MPRLLSSPRVAVLVAILGALGCSPGSLRADEAPAAATPADEALRETPAAARTDEVAPRRNPAEMPAPQRDAALADLQISDEALRAALDASIAREESFDDAVDEYRVDSFVALLVIEHLLSGTASAPQFTRAESGRGYTVAGVAPGSLFARLGLESGDTVESIDDAPLDSPARAMLAISERTRSLELTVSRAGATRRIKYRITPGQAMRSRAPRRRPSLGDDDLTASMGVLEELLRREPVDPLGGSLLDEPPVPNSRAIPGAEEAIACTQSEPRECTVDKAFVEQVLANPALLSKQARVIPAIREGETRGFKFYGIRPGSLPKLIGMKNGDMVTRVNGEALTSLDDAMELYTKLKTAKTIQLSIDRKGQSLAITLRFR